MRSSFLQKNSQTLIENLIKQKKELILRIPPSPTGNLHIGTARTAIYNLLLAKKYAGKLILRLEDTDQERSKSKYVSDILNNLRWLGITWDEGPFRQSEHQVRHAFVLEELKKKNLAYECFCTPEELENLRQKQKKNNQAPGYDNRHRNLTEENKKLFREENRKPVIRIKIPGNKVISWFDLIKGKVEVNTNDLGGDFVIAKENSNILYNFAVVVDDHDQKVNLVVRGEDHLHNTAKQIVLYQALDWDIPLFAHVPLILNKDREKLSKRKHGEIASINKYKKEGYLPEAIVNYLIAMSWQFSKNKLDETQEIFKLEEISEQFEISSISKNSAIYDEQKLDWFSREYFKKLPTKSLLGILEKYKISELKFLELEQQKILELFLSQTEKFKIDVLDSVRDKLSKLSQIPVLVYLFMSAPSLNSVSPEDKIILCKQENKEILRNLKQILSELPDPIDSKVVLNQLSKQTKIKKGKNLFFPIRIALWGKTKGPDLGVILSILDKQDLTLRIKKAIEF